MDFVEEAPDRPRKDSEDAGAELLDPTAAPPPPGARPRSSLWAGSRSLLPYGALVVVQLAYCVWHVLGKVALNGGTNPFVLALYRQLGACACLAALARAVDRPAVAAPASPSLARAFGDLPSA